MDNDVSISKGQTRTSCVNAKAGTTLKITLVWTDPPGTLSAAIILVNNLDLKVTDTKGAVIWGNSAANGPKADTLNNVEHVRARRRQTPCALGGWGVTDTTWGG